MNTKVIMIVSAVFLMILGLILTFLPVEIAEYLSVGPNQTSILFLQILGSLYLGFGMLNWMTKSNLIGGIYSRPLVTGNLVHFLVASFALIKMVEKHSERQFSIILSLTIIYSVLTLCFGYIFMVNPKKLTDKN